MSLKTIVCKYCQREPEMAPEIGYGDYADQCFPCYDHVRALFASGYAALARQLTSLANKRRYALGRA